MLSSLLIHSHKTSGRLLIKAIISDLCLQTEMHMQDLVVGGMYFLIFEALLELNFVKPERMARVMREGFTFNVHFLLP